MEAASHTRATNCLALKPAQNELARPRFTKSSSVRDSFVKDAILNHFKEFSVQEVCGKGVCSKNLQSQLAERNAISGKLFFFPHNNPVNPWNLIITRISAIQAASQISQGSASPNNISVNEHK